MLAQCTPRLRRVGVSRVTLPPLPHTASWEQIQATETMLTILEAYHDFFFDGFQHFSSFLPEIERVKEAIDEMVCTSHLTRSLPPSLPPSL